jgi:acetoacetyl-CoA synthetase
LEKVSPLPSQILVTLRRGEQGAPLYMFPGSGGDVRELSLLARSVACPNPVIGFDYNALGQDKAMPLTVNSIAHRCAVEIQAARPSGPYYLAGYSFGGLVAFEIAQLLRGAGQEVELLILIDKFFGQRFWPMPLFFKSQFRRVFWHLKKLTSQAPGAALAEFGIRTRNLLQQVGERFVQSTHRSASGGVSASVEEQCVAAIASYRPSYYPGRINIIRARADDDLACSPELLWRKYSDFVSETIIPGTHLATMSDPESITRLADVIDRYLAEASVPAEQRKRH